MRARAGRAAVTRDRTEVVHVVDVTPLRVEPGRVAGVVAVFTRQNAVGVQPAVRAETPATEHVQYLGTVL